MRKIFIVSLFLYGYFIFSVDGQQTIELKLFPEKLEVSQKDPILEFIVSIKNFDMNKVSLLASKIVDVGMDSSFFYCWNLNVFYQEERRIIFRFDMLYRKEFQRYYILKPFQNKCFSFKINFRELIHHDLKHNLPEDGMISLREITEKENRDFGVYEISIEYMDSIQKRKNAIAQKISSNIVKVNYTEN